jgi:demethylmenaquinone methyltransferase/2-methoxy-6-polyprenyl-1,4-benzoquinol methylase
MFDRIVPRYDLMNRLMTGGRDRAWRRLAVKAALASHPGCVADIATGTGDLAVDLARAGIERVLALDFSGGMLEAAQPKIARYHAVSLLRGDGMTLPFADDSIDSLTIGFGLRNMPDYGAAIAEFTRVVRPGGRIVILEMTPLPPSAFARLFTWYFRRIVPLVGGWLSGDRAAYDYLPASVAAFPDRDRLRDMLLAAGCSTVTVKSLGLGTVALHVGTVGATQS